MEYILKKKEDGTTITVRDVQKVLLEMMLDIDKVCKKNHIEYFLVSGSALGAVRHHGFIPWDDDLDIGMMASEFPKFIEALERDLPGQYVFHCFEKNKKYIVTWPAMKIRKKGTYLKEVNTLLQNKCKDSDGLFIDVFLYDYMAKHTLPDLPLRLVNTILTPIIIFFENINFNPKLLKRMFRGVARLNGKLNRHSKYIGDDLTWTYRNPLKPYRYLYTDVFPTKRISFEGHMLPVPNNDKHYLTAHFGPDYMTPPPEEKRAPKHIVDIEL